MVRKKFSRFVVITRRFRSTDATMHAPAWKIAYADFVTAMMAFFLLLWLLNAATRAQVSGVAEYFAQKEAVDNQLVSSNSPATKELSGDDESIGNLTFEQSNPAVLKLLKKPQNYFTGNADHTVEITLKRDESNVNPEALSKTENSKNSDEGIPIMVSDTSDSHVEDRNTMMIESRKDGLDVNIADSRGVFHEGTAKFTAVGIRQLAQISTLITYNYSDVYLNVEGHTSVKASDNNWELSLKRGYAVMSWLIDNDFSEENILSVDGFAAKNLLDPDNSTEAINDRVVLKFIAFDRLQNFEE